MSPASGNLTDGCRQPGIFSATIELVTPASRKRITTDSEKNAVATRAETIATYCLCAIITLAPLPLGSTDQRVIAVWVLLLAVVAGLATFGSFTPRDVVFLSGFAVVGACWGLVVFEQTSRAPILADQLISPIWQQTAAIIGQGLAGTISVALHQPYFTASAQIACLLSMVGGFLVGRDRNAAHRLLNTFAGAGLVYAIYGIVAFIFWPEYLLWQEKFSYRNSLVATFTNPNVAAVYFGACSAVWLLILSKTLSLVATKQGYRWRDFIETLLSHPSRRTVICFAALLTVLSSVFMTGSRAGSILSLIAISGATATLYRREIGPRRLLWAFPLYAAGAIIMLLQVFGSKINQRFDSEGLFDSGRWSVYLATLKIIADHPWLGTGLGSFRWAFPRYRSDDISVSGIWEQAHSTTLEIASEMGIPFIGLVTVGWLIVFFVLRRGMLARKRDEILPLAAFWVGLLAVVHSQIDFSLQIPGFSIPICALVGMGLAQAASSQRVHSTAKDPAS